MPFVAQWFPMERPAHIVPPLAGISMDNSTYYHENNAPISYRTREKIVKKVLGKQDTVLKDVDVDVTFDVIEHISSEDQTCFCHRIDERFRKTYMDGEPCTFFYAVSYHLFGEMKYEFAKGLYDIIAKTYPEWKMFDIFVGTAAVLRTDILVFVSSDRNKTENIKRISPYIVHSPQYQKYTGSIYVFQNTTKNCFEAVIGVHENSIPYYMANNPGRMGMDIILQDDTRRSIPFPKINHVFPDNVFQYLPLYTPEFNVDMDTEDYQRIEKFLEDNTSFQPCIKRDGKLYTFAKHVRFESLETCIYDAFMDEKNCRDLNHFLNDCDQVPRKMTDHAINQLDSLDLQQINELPPSRFKTVQTRIDQMNDFLSFISEIANRVSNGPVALLRFSMERMEVFLEDWYTLPVNVHLQSVYPILVLNKTRFVLCGRLLVFIDKHSLAYIDIFDNNSNVRYSKIFPGGPKTSELQLCISDRGSMYIFHPISLRYAYIDNEMNVWPWTKLELIHDYEQYDFENSPFTMLTVYPQCGPTLDENSYFDSDSLERADEIYREDYKERLALRMNAKQQCLAFIGNGNSNI